MGRNKMDFEGGGHGLATGLKYNILYRIQFVKFEIIIVSKKAF